VSKYCSPTVTSPKFRAQAPRRSGSKVRAAPGSPGLRIPDTTCRPDRARPPRRPRQEPASKAWWTLPPEAARTLPHNLTSLSTTSETARRPAQPAPHQFAPASTVGEALETTARRHMPPQTAAAQTRAPAFETPMFPNRRKSPVRVESPP